AAAFTAAVEHNEGFREARYRLAEMHAEAGSYELALTELKRAAGLDPEATAERGLRPVETVLATRGDIQREITTSGTIEAVADVSVYAKMPGRVEDILVDEGMRVGVDDVVAILEHEELELQALQASAAALAAAAAHEQVHALAEVRVRAQAAQAAAGLQAAEAALKLVQDLAETRAHSQTDQAEAGLAVIQANLAKLRRGLRDEERAQIRAGLAQAVAAREDASRNAERMQTLFDNGAISKQTLDSAGTLLDVAKAQDRAAREQLAMAENGSREEDISSLEAQVRQAEAGVMVARKQADSQTWESDIAMAAAQVEQARAGDTTARSLVDAKSWEAEITAASAAVTQAEASLALAEKRLDDAFIKAPIAGTIARRSVDPGDMANPAAPILDIVQMDTVRATVRVLEADLADLAVGGPAGVLLQTLPSAVAASISRISPTVDSASRTAEVEIEMSNADGAARPGMFARVSFPIDVRRNAILLPRDTVVQGSAGDGAYVYAVSNGRARRAPVEQGLTNGGSVQVIAGVDAGVEVVYSGRQSLREGDFVKVVRRVDAW
ncbi:efflux RND transporter periplasmic adaptor subunit, partial [Candidatus Poribacteria bacterium]|nr:efflux RND transporter periplasmic adaptor subunit [Candidatus Poribacteria bacterium]